MREVWPHRIMSSCVQRSPCLLYDVWEVWLRLKGTLQEKVWEPFSPDAMGRCQHVLVTDERAAAEVRVLGRVDADLPWPTSAYCRATADDPVSLVGVGRNFRLSALFCPSERQTIWAQLCASPSHKKIEASWDSRLQRHGDEIYVLHVLYPSRAICTDI